MKPKKPPLPAPKRGRPEPPRPPAALSDPEIRFEYGPAGRETLSAIAEEVVDLARDIQRRDLGGSAPEIDVGHGPLGRESVNAIARELYEPEPRTAVRQRARTHGYEEPVGRDTIDEIARAIGTEPEEPLPEAEADALEIYEMVTFVVRGRELGVLSTEAGRRHFVEQRLFSRLPVSSMQDVVRIDVTPWTARGTLIVRVWCALAG